MDSKVRVVDFDPTKPQAVAEKPILSAAAMKKVVGRKQRLYDGITHRGSRKAVPGQFVCMSCWHAKPNSELGRDRGVKRQQCKACDATAVSIVDGTYRSKSGNTHAAFKRAEDKKHKKTYASGKLPKWMLG